MTRNRRSAFVVGLSLIALVTVVSAGARSEQAGLIGSRPMCLPPSRFGPWARAIVTGRIADIEIDPNNASTWYVATAFGGLWKTTNRGITFDQIFPRSGEVEAFTLCCIVVDPKNSNVLWLGTGENAQPAQRALRRWPLQVDRCGQVVEARGPREFRAHRQDPHRPAQLVRRVGRVAGTALLGGRRARRVQDDRRRRDVDARPHVSDNTGITDIVFDPKNPDVIFAGGISAAVTSDRRSAEALRRHPQDDRRLARAWTKLTTGLPTGDVGRVALAIDPKKPGRVYALIEAKSRRRRAWWRSWRWRRRGGALRSATSAAAAAGRRRQARAGGAGARRPRVRCRSAPRGGGGAGGDGRCAAATSARSAADDGVGFYVSDDSGATWTRMSTYRGGGSGSTTPSSSSTRDRPDTSSRSSTNLSRSTRWRRDVVEHRPREQHAARRARSHVHVDHHDVDVRSRRQEPLPARQRRRRVRDVRRRRDVAVLRESADHAVLPRRHQQREAVLLRCAAARRTTSRSAARRAPRTRWAFATATGSTSSAATASRRGDMEDQNIVYASRRTVASSRFDRRTGRGAGLSPTRRGGGWRRWRRRRRERRSSRSAGAAAAAGSAGRRAGRQARRPWRAAAAGGGRRRRRWRRRSRPTGMRRSSSARTRPRASTSRASSCIAATIAATTGRASAPTSRAI